jgi:hypothetical protein
VEKVATVNHEGEPGDDGLFKITSEDAITTLNELILDARKLLGTADKSRLIQTGCKSHSEVTGQDRLVRLGDALLIVWVLGEDLVK